MERCEVTVADATRVRSRAYDGRVPDPTESLSALPSIGARIVAYVAILLGGLAGGVIGYALVDVLCDGNCGLPLGLGIFAGSTLTAGGTAIVSVLVLRALGEWREISDVR